MTKTIPSAVTDAEAAELAKIASGRRVVELGTGLGRATFALAKTANQVHTIDWHRGDEHAGKRDTLVEFAQNLAESPYRDKIIAHIGRFGDILCHLCRCEFGAAFIDGYHSAEDTADNLRRVWPLLHHAGSEIALHDYGLYGVKEGVERWLEQPNVRARFDRQIESLYILRKF